MGTYTTSKSLIEALSRHEGCDRIGFVPTMGALHEGHLSRIRRALQENDCVVVSIFVNPTQFDNPTDLKKYPRMMDKDVALIDSLKRPIFIFTPDVSDMYPKKVASTHFNFGGIEGRMEGKHRKGHFDGVGTIVSALFKMVKPTNAYFGEKDFQQLQIVKKLVTLEKLPVHVIGCPIIREKNGLAKSSRNKRLTKKQIVEATIIYKTLREIKDNFSELSIPKLNELVKERFLNSTLKLEYFEIANEMNLKTAKRKNKGTKYRGFIAAFAGSVRLIDNMSLN